MHENLRLKSEEKPIKIHQANISHYGCPAPFTFSDYGRLLNDKSRSDWKESSFMFSYQFAYSQLKIFNDFYLKNNIYNFSSEELRDKALKYFHEQISILNGSLEEL
jgi:hypothetical protein